MTTGLVGPRPSSPSRKTLAAYAFSVKTFALAWSPICSHDLQCIVLESPYPPANYMLLFQQVQQRMRVMETCYRCRDDAYSISNHAIEAGNFVRSSISGKYSRYRDDTRREKIWGMKSVGDSSEPERKNARSATAKREHKSAQGQQPANSSKAAEKKYRQPRDECQSAGVKEERYVPWQLL